jgi:hypothetical protein
MGLFNKKTKKDEIKRPDSSFPQLPELPKLPELPPLNEYSYDEEQIPQLPSFPTNSLGEKFSQNTIKEAITGKEEDEEVFDEEEFTEKENLEMRQKPLTKSSVEDFENYEENFPLRSRSKETSQNFRERYSSTKKAEPVFIRLDKFEESMKLFTNIKKQITEIEDLIKDTKDVKAREEVELTSWENQLQEIKKQVEKVDQDIFSKIE